MTKERMEEEKQSVQKRFERGEPNTGILCLGYDWNPETKSFTINEEEGKWVNRRAKAADNHGYEKISLQDL
ncbi:MAG: hypothetical protein PUD20_10840 [bacterium]|nr:hypothetical protein [bacterium]